MADVYAIAPHRSDDAPEVLADLWLAFWDLYPRREAKKAARKAWDRMSETDRLAAVIAIADWRQVWRAQARDTSVIPHPATWLNGERWTDEVPKGVISHQSVSTGHQSVSIGADLNTGAAHPISRGAIPAHVQRQLDKIRGKP